MVPLIVFTRQPSTNQRSLTFFKKCVMLTVWKLEMALSLDRVVSRARKVLLRRTTLTICRRDLMT